MDYELNDQDRADLVKNFVKKYGLWLILAIIVIALGFGIEAYLQKRNATMQQSAAVAYQALVNAAQSGSTDKQITASANELINTYPDTVYASFARMTLASIAMREDNPTEAETLLKAVLKQNSDNSLTPIITLRLARVYLSENKPAEAITLLQSPPAAFAASYQLLTGDALLLQNNPIAAKLSYLAAQKAASNDPLVSQLVTERLNSLGGNS